MAQLVSNLCFNIPSMRPILLLSKLSNAASRRSMHIGQIVIGRKAHYRLTESLQVINNVPTVLKAEVLRDERSSVPSRYVVVKTAVPGHEASRDGLIREYNSYKLQSVATSRCIRTMYDVVGDPQELNDESRCNYPGLVLEWFETTLQDTPPDQYRHHIVLLATIIRTVLCSSKLFDGEHLVNTDLKPDNILISDLNTHSPTVKIGDLGSVHNSGKIYESQPFAMRAPEVWRGLACIHQSEVWALAAMLLVWMNPSILGTSGINGYITAPIWSIAKLMKLFPGWKGPPSSSREFRRDEFEIAEMLSREPDPEAPGEQRVKVASLDKEMKLLQIPLALRDFLRALLIPQPEMRPSAVEAMVSEEYLALLKVASSTDTRLAALR